MAIVAAPGPPRLFSPPSSRSLVFRLSRRASKILGEGGLRYMHESTVMGKSQDAGATAGGQVER